MPLSDHFPDPRLPAITDIRNRWRYTRSTAGTAHTTLTVGNEQTTRIRQPLRIRQMKVGEVAGGTVTVQVKANGRDIFPDGNRPVSGGRPSVPHRKGSYIIPAGSILTTIVEASSGAPTGTAPVLIDTEPFELVPRATEVVLTGRQRLRVSARREARYLNSEQGLAEQVSPVGTTNVGAAAAVAASTRAAAGVVTPPKFAGGGKLPPRPTPPGPRI